MTTLVAFIAFGLTVAGLSAQTVRPGVTAGPPPTQATPPPAPAVGKPASRPGPPESAFVGVTTPADYVIGPDDALTIVVWREKELSGEVLVRPDGRISLPLINEIQAAGMTPEELRVLVTRAVAKLVEEPNVTVQVKQINSRKVFITGQIAKPGPYPIMGPMTVLQLVTMAGGVLEYADAENIQIIRGDRNFRVNYKDLEKGKNVKQNNIELKPGDQIVVP
jgi:polysaccharide export outer membrane protein